MNMSRGNFAEDDDVLIELYKEDSKPLQPVKGCVGERNLSINCHELRYLRRYLLIVGQWYPREWSFKKRVCYHAWQVCVTLGVWLHFLYSLGLFGDKVRNKYYYETFPINAMEDIVSNTRWVISHHLGLFYFCYTRHMENFLLESCFNQALWKETSRYLKKICVAVILIVFVVPVILRPAEIAYSPYSGECGWIIFDAIVLLLDRLFTAPIFLVFVFEAYVLVRVVKDYGVRIKGWPKDYKNVRGSGMRAAKMRYIKTHNLIGGVGSKFQLYLSLHFLFLLISAFFGVFACVEQIEKANENNSYYIAESPNYYKRLIKPAEVKMVPIESSRPHLKNLQLTMIAGSHGTILKHLKNNVTSENGKQRKSYRKARETQLLIEVGIEATLNVLESIILYMIPLTLMLRLQTKLSIIRQNILYSDCFEQQENGYLFQDEETIQTMAEFVQTCRGITIFGYKMPLFRTFLLSVFAPFLTALTTFLFSYMHIRRKY